jgi:[acyl-carrier-protein] S-malonyltransferase
MAHDLIERSAAARAVYETADRVTGLAISALCTAGPDEELQLTKHAQPAILTTSIACLEAAREAGPLERVPPSFVAGHSLGEYTAVVAAQAVSLEDGLRLVAERGRLMQETAEANPGAMAALLGIDEEEASAVCALAGAQVCNLNAPGQVVVGGTLDAVEAAMRLGLERGAQRGVLLKVSGAYHTEAMAPAAEGMKNAIARTAINDPTTPVIANTNALPLVNAGLVRDDLVDQIVSPVQWQGTVEYLATQGVNTVIEFGPERVLTGLVRRIDRSIDVHNVQDVHGATTLHASLAAPA